MNHNLELGKKVVDMATSAGAKQCAVNIDESVEVECELRNGQVEKLANSSPRRMNLSLFVDDRFASHVTTDFRPASLEKFIKDAVALTKLLEADPLRSLPDPKWYQGRTEQDLGLYDPTLETKKVEQRKAVALVMEQAARAAGRDVVSITTACSDSCSYSTRVSSNGFADWQRETYTELTTAVTLREGDRRPEDYWSIGKTNDAMHTDPAAIGRRAAERAVSRLAAKKVPSGAMPILVENRAAIKLISALNGALAGHTVQQKRSFLEGKRGQKVVSDKLTLRDDPMIRGAVASRKFDGEGMTARPFTLIRNGVLENYYLDWYYAQKMKMEPTVGGGSNLVIEPGKDSRESLEKSIKKGLVITSFIGGNSNALTGDFSFGVVGYAVENGVRTHAVAEVNLSGNQKTFWNQLLALGNDPFVDAQVRAPSLLIDAAAISGA